MIRSCEDIKTSIDFVEFYNFRHNTHDMGLEETADIICWDRSNIICPELFEIWN